MVRTHWWLRSYSSQALERYKLKAECLFLICLGLLFSLNCSFWYTKVARGVGGGVPIPFPNPIFLKIPFLSFQIPFPLALFRKIPEFYITSSFVSHCHSFKIETGHHFQKKQSRTMSQRFTGCINVVIILFKL